MLREEGLLEPSAEKPTAALLRPPTEVLVGRVARRRARHEMSPEEREQLFYREIALSELPARAAEIPEDTEFIRATVHAADTLAFDENVIHLRRHQLFAFNGLIYLRDQPGGIARADMFDLRFASDGSERKRSSNWTRATEYLLPKVNEAAGAEVFSKTGRDKWTRYHVHPGLLLERGDNYQERPPGFYEFAQRISGPLLRVPRNHTVWAGTERPFRVVIRDDDTVVVNHIATQLNEHDRSLLRLIALGDGEPLTLEQIFGLGFHAYGVCEQAKNSALYRSVHKLNAALDTNEERPLLHLNTTIAGTSIHTLRSFTLSDIRPHDHNAPELSQVDQAFHQLLEEAPENVIDTGPSRNQLVALCQDYGEGLLTLTEAYTLSLRLGVRFPFLEGTSYRTRVQHQLISYDAIAEQIVPGTPLVRSLISRLLGGTSDGPVHSSESYAIMKLQKADRMFEQKGGPLGKLIARIHTVVPEKRVNNLMSGSSPVALMAMLGRPAVEQIAVAAHLTPGGRPRDTDLRNALSWLRRHFKNFLATLEADEQLRQFEGVRARYLRAAGYFLQLVGSPSEGLRATSFTNLAAADPGFAREGLQLTADMCALLLHAEKQRI